GVGTSQMAARGVTFAKVQAIATNRLLGRSTASSGDIEEITLGTLFSGRLPNYRARIGDR
ncbi:MAG TPA: hypothetical protein VL308_17820, partial [Gemmatimonadaceae bacterium]|nr:hypothetical protein [Gemmatimonadaceae bacterium]